MQVLSYEEWKKMYMKPVSQATIDDMVEFHDLTQEIAEKEIEDSMQKEYSWYLEKHPSKPLDK